MVAEVIGGLISGSLALLADASHMLTDAAGIGLALLAAGFAARPATPEHTFGYMRFEILASVINALVLFGVAGDVLMSSGFRRIWLRDHIRLFGSTCQLFQIGAVSLTKVAVRA